MFFEDSRAYLTALPRFNLSAADVQIVLDTKTFAQNLLQAIAHAQSRIYIAALYLQEDAGGQQILEALYQAKSQRPQLDIKILVDWHRAQRGLIGAQQSLGNAAWYRAMAAQHPEVEIPIYGVPVQTRELFGVFHLKGFIIDDSVIYSGASLNNVYLHVLDKYRYDRYFFIRQPELANSMATFLNQAILAQAAIYRLDQPDVPSTKIIRPQIRQFRDQLKHQKYMVVDESDAKSLGVIPVVGVGKRNALNHFVKRVLAAARQRVVVCTPYFNLPRPVTREINHLLKQGIQVDIIVGDKTANDFYISPDEPFKVIGGVPYLYEANLRRFAKAHQISITKGLLNLYLWHDGDNTYHLKGIWVDEDLTFITGNNLNPRAFNLDLENGLLITDPEGVLCEKRSDELAAILKHTKRVEHYREIDLPEAYPEPVKKLIKRLSRVRADRLVSKLL